MAEIIKHHAIVDDAWKLLTLAANESASEAKLPYGPVIVPLSVWRVRKADLMAREWEQGHALGVWLAPSEDPAELADDLENLSVVGVHFPTVADGRGYSIATLLRTRYGYAGELRAFGAIGRDHLHYLHRVGFDSFALKRPERAIAGLDDFSEAYQAAANQPLPLFRRVQAAS